MWQSGYSLFMRFTTTVVLVTFTMLILEPAALAAQALHEEHRQQQAQAARDQGRGLEHTLRGLQQVLAKIHREDSPGHTELTALRAQLPDLDAQIRADFAAVAAHIRGKNLPALILERHAQALADYQREQQTLLDNLAALDKTKGKSARQQAAGKALGHLQGLKKGRAHQPFDPAALPYQTFQPPADNLPKTTTEAFRAAGLYDTPLVKLAGLGDFRFDTLAGANDPAYLDTTPEIVLSRAIRAKAEALDYNPVKIYQFVYNHIHWLPTWGAMQDADLTLASRQGNAADISALLIALLRASGIPARYVHGTIDVPVARFMNWAGDFSDVHAAGIHAASGGIPVTPVVSGGEVKSYRIEHIWAEAATDMIPSGGARNFVADSWAAMDASFKQYDFLQGIDVEAVAPLDSEALLTEFAATGTRNDPENWATGFDPGLLGDALDSRRTTLEQYISANFPEPTVGDIIGGQRIRPMRFTELPRSLPNRIHLIGARYAEMPDPLRHRVSFDFNRTQDNVLGGGERADFPVAALNNRKITLSFKPATAADEAALASLLPEGEITDLSQLPSTIPAYLAEVTAELKVDGVTVLSGAPLALGADQNFNFSVYTPSFGTRAHPSPVVAGSYLSVAMVGGSFSPRMLETLQNTLQTHKTAWEAGDVSDFNRENFLGDMFYTGTLGYFAQYAGLTALQARQAGVAFQLMPSLGTYGMVPAVDYLFGFPRSISPGGVEMDMDRVASVFTVKNGEQDQRFGFTFAAGMLSSALEHGVPEQMFVREGDNAEAVSAVKALFKVNAQGIPIYHITRDNAAGILPHLHLNELAMAEIEAALAVGREVITHQTEISVPGWSGAGYIIYDPVTGDGAFKIGGGLNGAFLGMIVGVLLVATIVFLFAAIPPLTAGLIASSSIIGVISTEVLADIALFFGSGALALLVGMGIVVHFESILLNEEEFQDYMYAFLGSLAVTVLIALTVVGILISAPIIAILEFIFAIMALVILDLQVVWF